MKAREGYVFFDERTKKWVARFSPFVNATARKNFTRSRTTRKEALQALRELVQEYESKGVTAFDNRDLNFEQLADRYRDTKMIEAEFVGERKVAGMRAQSSAQSYWRVLRKYFGKKRIITIKYADLEALKLYLVRKPTQHGKQRTVTDTNRHLQFLRAMLNYAVANGWLETNPFKLAGGAGSKLIERSAESRGERFPTFGEELALIRACTREGVRGNAHLRSILIVAADTGLRKNELLTLTVSDLDFNERVIRLRAINAKTNRKRGIPMTTRVQSELQKLSAKKQVDDFVFDGVGDFKRSFGTLKRTAGIDELNFHDFRHAFVSRSILAGVPTAIVLKASGHASEEWKRYLNVTPDQLRRLLDPVGEQTAEEVKDFARSVMKGLREAMQYDEIEKLFEL
jgi:integrase